MVAAKPKDLTFQDPAIAGLPIPPAESLEEWVCHFNDAIRDKALSVKQQQAVIAWLRKNPEAVQYHEDYLKFEVTMMDYFDSPALSEDPELIEEMASPIW